MAHTILNKAHQSAQSNRLWWRIGVLLILVIAFVLSLISFLNYSNYRKNYLELNLTRYLIMGKDLRQTIESGLNIGISPAANIQLRPTMTALAQRQAGTRFLGILDESGIALTEGNFADKGKAYWQQRLAQTAADGYWQASSDTHFEIGMPFSNNFNIKIGAVVIGYERAGIEAALAQMRRKLIVNLLQTLLLCSVVIFAGAYLLTRKLAGDLAVVEQALQHSLDAPEPAKIEDGVLGQTIAQEINLFSEISHKVALELTQLEADARTGVHGAAA